jgi:hypothetical protein
MPEVGSGKAASRNPDSAEFCVYASYTSEYRFLDFIAAHCFAPHAIPRTTWGIFDFLRSELRSILSSLHILLEKVAQYPEIGTGSNQESIRETIVYFD